MPKITYISHEGKKNTVEVASGLTVMEGAIQNNIEGIDADCGGSMACATCHVMSQINGLINLKNSGRRTRYVRYGLRTEKNSRLSCQIILTDELDGLEVTTPEKTNLND